MTSRTHDARLDFSEWIGPHVGAPGAQGLVSPIVGLAILAAVAWRVAVRIYRQRDDREYEEGDE